MQFKKSIREYFDSTIVPCVELVYLTVDKNFISKFPNHKGVGAMSFDAFIVPIVKELNKLCGCTNLFLFAINHKKLIDYYKNQMDFEELPPVLEKYIVNNLKTKENEDCKFLYQHISLM